MVVISYQVKGALIRTETGSGPLENVDWFDPGEGAYEIGVDPDACLFFTGGYYDRAVALVAELQEPARKAWDPSRSRIVG